MNYLKYIYFYFLIFIHASLEDKIFTPRGRLGHSSVLVENKLYFFGGYRTDGCVDEVFALDLSESFNLTAPPWIDLKSSVGMPFNSCWGTVSFNDAEQIIYLFGGFMNDVTTNNDTATTNLLSFNLNSLAWDVPDIKGIPPKKRRRIKSVLGGGKMYVFGGDTVNILVNQNHLNQRFLMIWLF